MDPTLQYLASIVRAFVRREEPPASRDGSPDWDRLRLLLVTHQILPTTIAVLRKTDVPAGLQEELEDIARRLRLRSEILLLEFLRFYPTLQKRVDHAVALKGVVLSQTVYRRRSSRHFVDLDILVGKEDLGPACECLAEFGFKRPDWLRAEPVWYDRYHYHYVLQQSRGIITEIHWDLARPGWYVRFDLEGFVDRSRLINVDGIELRIPHETDTLLHVASQSLFDGFSSLRRIIDAALLVEACTEQELLQLSERSHKQGLASALWILLGLTEAVTGTAAPKQLVRSLRPPAFLRACFGSLGLRKKLLTAFARKRTGVRNLLVWLSAPDLRNSIRAIRRYMFPGTGYFLQKGLSEENLPGFIRRTLLSLQHGFSVLKLFAYLAWRLVTHFRMEI